MGTRLTSAASKLNSLTFDKWDKQFELHADAHCWLLVCLVTWSLAVPCYLFVKADLVDVLS